MFNIKNISKKLLICSASLMMMSSIELTNVSAHQIRHYHTRATEVMNRSSSIKNDKINQFKKTYYITTLLTKYHKKFTKSSTNRYNIKLNRLIQQYWKTFTPIQQLKILRLGIPYGAKFNIKLYNHMNQDVNSSQYNLNQFSNQGNLFVNNIRNELIKDINNTRHHYHVNPLKVTTIMQRGANYRAPRVQYAYEHLSDYNNYPHNTSNPSDNWVHGRFNNTDINSYLGAHGYNMFALSNASTFYKTNNSTLADGSQFKYDNTTAKGIADNINDDLMNHDETNGNNDYHRCAELDPEVTYLGVGVAYNPQNNLGSINEQFGYDLEIE